MLLQLLWKLCNQLIGKAVFPLFLLVGTGVCVADSTSLAPATHTTMVQVAEPDTTSPNCYVVRSRTIYAHATQLPEKTGETVVASPVCATGYVPAGAYGSVAGGETYLVVAGQEHTYGLHTTGTSFGIKCCPVKATWKERKAQTPPPPTLPGGGFQPLAPSQPKYP